jgi:transposase
VPAGLLSRASWGAVLAGSLAAIALLALLSLLGLAIGLGTIDPAQESAPLRGLGTGTVVWLIVTGIIALFIGGFVSGRLAGQPQTLTSALHGLVTWSVTTILLIYLAGTTAGAIATGAAGVVRQAASLAGTAATQVGSVTGNAMQAVVQAMPGALPQQAQQALERWNVTTRTGRRELVDLLNRSGITQREAQAAAQATRALATDLVTSPGDAGEDIRNYADKLFGGQDAVISPEERRQVINTIQQRTGLSDQEIQRTLSRIENSVEAARTELVNAAQDFQRAAVQAAETTADTLSTASWTAFFALLLGLAAALVGAVIGTAERLGFPVRRSR